MQKRITALLVACVMLMSSFVFANAQDSFDKEDFDDIMLEELLVSSGNCHDNSFAPVEIEELYCDSALVVEDEMVSEINLMSYLSDFDSDVTYYGREALSRLENGELLVYLYDCFYECIATASQAFPVYDGVNSVNSTDIKNAFIAWRFDHAEQFWATNSFKVTRNADTILTISPNYTIGGEELEKAKIEFENAIQDILSNLNESMTDFEKQLFLHDYLAEKNTYTLDSEHSYNAYGGIVLGKVVCEGYAEAFQVLLHRAGINSFIASGKSKDDGVPHGWNVVEIDGKWYHTDLTWNDGEKYIYHSYFNVPTEMLELDHLLDERIYQYPECNSYDANYYKVRGGFVEEYTVTGISELLKKNSLKADMFFPATASDFMSWLNGNADLLIDACGLTSSASISCKEVGNEIFLSVNTFDPDALDIELAVSDEIASKQLIEITKKDGKAIVGCYVGTSPVCYENDFVVTGNDGFVSWATEISDSCKLYFTTEDVDGVLSVTYELDFVKTEFVIDNTQKPFSVLQCTLTPSFALPSLEKVCHTFLGWSSSEGALTPEYPADFEYSPEESGVLYAVWEADHVYSNEWRMDEKYHWQECLCGENAASEHYYTGNFDAVCNECEYKRSLAGNVDGNDVVNTDDAIYLLRHTLLPGVYPVDADADFDCDGAVKTDDAIYLLRHTLLPGVYPLYTPKSEK